MILVLQQWPSSSSDMTPSTPGSLAGDVDMADENSIVSVKERALKLNKIESESELHKQISPPRKKTVSGYLFYRCIKKRIVSFFIKYQHSLRYHAFWSIMKDFSLWPQGDRNSTIGEDDGHSTTSGSIEVRTVSWRWWDFNMVLKLIYILFFMAMQLLSLILSGKKVCYHSLPGRGDRETCTPVFPPIKLGLIQALSLE